MEPSTANLLTQKRGERATLAKKLEEVHVQERERVGQNFLKEEQAAKEKEVSDTERRNRIRTHLMKVDLKEFAERRSVQINTEPEEKLVAVPEAPKNINVLENLSVDTVIIYKGERYRLAEKPSAENGNRYSFIPATLGKPTIKIEGPGLEKLLQEGGAENIGNLEEKWKEVKRNLKERMKLLEKAKKEFDGGDYGSARKTYNESLKVYTGTETLDILDKEEVPADILKLDNMYSKLNSLVGEDLATQEDREFDLNKKAKEAEQGEQNLEEDSEIEMLRRKYGDEYASIEIEKRKLRKDMAELRTLIESLED